MWNPPVVAVEDGVFLEMGLVSLKGVAVIISSVAIKIFVVTIVGSNGVGFFHEAIRLKDFHRWNG